jgi:hypothetical protein
MGGSSTDLGRVVDGVELVSTGAVAAFDREVHLRRPGREDEQPLGPFLADVLEFGHELGACVNLDGFHGKGHFGDDLVEEDRGGDGSKFTRVPRRHTLRTLRL